MNDIVLRAMLASRPEVAADGAEFAVDEAAELAVLLAAQSGQMALAKVRRLVLAEGFVSVETHEATYCLAYDRVVGLKVTARDPSSGRPGFRR